MAGLRSLGVLGPNWLLQDLIYKHKVAPPPSGTNAWAPDPGPVEVFGTNKVGMLVGNPSQVAALQKITAFEWNVAPLPVGKGGKRGTGGGGTAWSIAQGTKNVDAAWAFLKLITSAQAQHDEVAAGATTPSRKAVVPNIQLLFAGKEDARTVAKMIKELGDSMWAKT